MTGSGPTLAATMTPTRGPPRGTAGPGLAAAFEDELAAACQTGLSDCSLDSFLPWEVLRDRVFHEGPGQGLFC